jgi:hypothetical protein
MKRKNPDTLFSSKEDADAALDFLKRHLAEFPVVAGSVSTLGGAHRASVLLTVSLDPRESWANHILENSRYAKFHLSYDGTLEQISGYRIGKMRKSKANSITDAGRKLREFLHKAPKSNPSGVRIVFNKLLGGWYIVRGPHQTPLGGRFNSKAEAQAHLSRKKNPRPKTRARKMPVPRFYIQERRSKKGAWKTVARFHKKDMALFTARALSHNLKIWVRVIEK